MCSNLYLNLFHSIPRPPYKYPSSFKFLINPNQEKDKDNIEDNKDLNPKTDSQSEQANNELGQKGDSRSCLLENRDEFGAS